ncbi:MAG TPA: hypothetical protein VFY65_01415 [Longimicrobium sp.]|nr:hypothetical protein [Longimicrobium sp.]
MSLHETLDITGRLTLRMHAPDGRVVDERVAHNDITVHGRELVARLFNATVQAEVPRVSRMCVGSGDRKFAETDNALVAPVGCTPITSVEESTVTDANGKTRHRLRITGELGEKDCNGELREAGLFTARDEVMYNRVTFKPINKSPEFQLTLVWDILF